MTVFFDSADGRVALGGTAYATSAAHLGDELALADLRLARARCRLAGESIATLDAQIATMRAWIDERVVAGEELPITRTARLLALAPWELDALLLLAAIDLDGRRLAMFAVNEVPPMALTATTLWAALGDASGGARWQAELFTAGSLVARGIAIRDDERLPQSASPLRLARNVFGALCGVEYDEPLLDGLLRTPTLTGRASRDAERLARSLGVRGIAMWISGGTDALALVQAIADRAGREVRALDIRAIAREAPARRLRIARALHLDQRLRDWVGLVDANELNSEGLAALGELADSMAGPMIVVSDGDVTGLGTVVGGAPRHALGRPDATERNRIWTRALAGANARLAEAQIHELADAFPMAEREIDELVERVVFANTGNAPIALDVFRNACVARQSARLGRLADFVPRSFHWADLVLPTDELERLREIMDRQRHRHTVFATWSMATKVPYGTGTAVLFSGPPGTGKTMAASVVAGELERELYRVDLSRIVDKYIGETEKNLGRIFDAAADADAVLLFDEADSLFGKRSTVQSSNDRYANLETNYLLQRIEQHPGISILTTNHVQNIDEAFSRRIPFRVEFPFPEPRARAEIWRRCFTDDVPREALDYAAIGRAYELSGGHIKSAVLRAVFMAAAAGVPVSRQHVARAAARELEAMGKLL